MTYYSYNIKKINNNGEEKIQFKMVPVRGWVNENRPKINKPLKYNIKIDMEISRLVNKKGWTSTEQYFDGNYQCIGLMCDNPIHKDFPSEWHVPIEDLLENWTYCPGCNNII